MSAKKVSFTIYLIKIQQQLVDLCFTERNQDHSQVWRQT